jgi:predicted enzyme related to lactoylglutathione lyase
MSQPATNAQQPSSSLDATSAAGASRFVWHDIMTTDLPAAMAFYTELFDWQVRAWDMGEGGSYDMLYAGEQGIGGMMPLDAGDGMPSHWIGYVSVRDVDAACATADATGGRTRVPPTDIPTVGRFAVVEDPAGAVFSPFRGDGPDMAAPANAPLGTMAWNELMTTDAERAAEFYGRLTGWTVERMDMGAMGSYWLFRSGGMNVCGMSRMMPPDVGEPRAQWMPYVAVADADASAGRAAELGATVLVPPTDIEHWGRFAVLRDPTGAAVGILQNKQPM